MNKPPSKPIKINIIPHSLMDATYKQLQRLAKHYGIKANLPREELEDALFRKLEEVGTLYEIL